MRTLLLVLLVALPAGCLGASADLVWTLRVEPLEPLGRSARWTVNLPMPVGGLEPEALVRALVPSEDTGSVDVRHTLARDGQPFVQLSGRRAATLTAHAEVPRGTNVTFVPVLEGVPVARVVEGPEVRVVDTWRIDGRGCRGESWGLLGGPGDTTAMRRLSGPC